MKAKTVVLSKARKELIINFKSRYNKGCSPGSDPWIGDLHDYMAQYDRQIKLKDVVRWCKTHSWINKTTGAVVESGPGNPIRDQTELSHMNASASNSMWTSTGTTGNSIPSTGEIRRRLMNYYGGTSNSAPTSTVRHFSAISSPGEPDACNSEDRDSDDDTLLSSTTTSLLTAPSKTRRSKRIKNLQNESEMSVVCPENSDAVGTGSSEVDSLSRRPETQHTQKELQKTQIVFRTKETSCSDLLLETTTAPILEQMAYLPANDGVNSTRKKKMIDYGTVENLKNFNRAFASIKFLSDMCQDYDALLTALTPISELGKIFSRVHYRITVPVTYEEAHRNKLKRMKMEVVEISDESQESVDLSTGFVQQPELETANRHDERSQNGEPLPAYISRITIHN